MLVSEILRIKGNALFTTSPHGTVLAWVRGASALMAHSNESKTCWRPPMVMVNALS